MEKQAQEKLRMLAKMLPNAHYTTREQQEISGADLLLCDQKEVDGKPIEPEKMYVMSSPVIHEMNHYRRLKRSYLKNGIQGVKNYLFPYSKDKLKVSRAIDAIFAELVH